MFFKGSWRFGTYAKLDVKVGIAANPVGPNGKSVSLFNGLGDSISKQSANIDNASKWVAFLGTAEAQDIVASHGIVFPAIAPSPKKAAEALEQAGKDRGITVAIEGQGSGKIDALDPELIKRASAVIFAHDLPVKGRERFAGKPVIDVGVKAAVNDAGSLVDKALAAVDDPSAARVPAGSESAEESEEGSEHWARRLQRSVMTGVSYMIPFVAAGGLLIALGFLLAGYDVANLYEKISISDYSLWNLPGNEFVHEIKNSAGDVVGTETITVSQSGLLLYIGWTLFLLGQAAMSFLVPALAGYISFGLAGRPGIAPGFVMGVVAVEVGAGFIGGLVGGILAGYFAAWLAGLGVPAWLRGLMPVVIIPLGTTLVVGAVMYLVLGLPPAAPPKAAPGGAAWPPPPCPWPSTASRTTPTASCCWATQAAWSRPSTARVSPRPSCPAAWPPRPPPRHPPARPPPAVSRSWPSTPRPSAPRWAATTRSAVSSSPSSSTPRSCACAPATGCRASAS